MCSYQTPKKVRIIVEKTNPDKDGLTCDCLKEGDVFDLEFERCPANFCSSAYHSIWPSLRVLEMGGRHPWDKEEGVTYSCCSDPNRVVVFRLEVIK